jgi:deoxyribodipyrimidine photo-lyase
MDTYDYLNMHREFANRDDLINYLKAEFPRAATRDSHIPETRGGRAAAEAKLNDIKPASYARTRNYLDGDVSYLSPYLRHGVLSLAEVRDRALQMTSPKKAEKFVNELCWRDYWQRVYTVIGDDIWTSIEPYKTGYAEEAYEDTLPEDIRAADTNSPCINMMIRELYETGYLHNRLRMYLASYVVHWRRVKWQVGASWFLEHLLDGDPASNNLSWQWVASTFGSKPYIFNQSNMDKYLEKVRGCGRPDPNFTGSYEEIAARLFPYGQGSMGAPSEIKKKLAKVTFSTHTPHFRHHQPGYLAARRQSQPAQPRTGPVSGSTCYLGLGRGSAGRLQHRPQAYPVHVREPAGDTCRYPARQRLPGDCPVRGGTRRGRHHHDGQPITSFQRTRPHPGEKAACQDHARA